MSKQLQSRKVLTQSKTPMRKLREKDTFEEVADEARSAYRLAMRIADLVNIENKCFYFNQSAAAPMPVPQLMLPTWSSMTPVILNAVERGTHDYQRVSDSMKIQHFDCVLTFNQALFPLTYRVVIFWDETNSTTQSLEVLEAAFFGTNLVTGIPKDWDEKASTKIMHDQLYRHLDAKNDAGPDNNVFVPINSGHRISFPINKHTQFEEGTTTIVTGALKMFIVSDVSAQGSVSWTSRIIFTDD